jgi:predicted amidohydrolase YtcJ
MVPMKSFIERGIPGAMSSDTPVTTINPFMNIYEAATRKTKDGQVCGESERVNVMEALCAYTVGGAHAAFEEQKKGSLEAGKVADVIVLSGDIVRMPIEEVKDMRVDLTISGGEIVYAKV